MPTYEYRCPEGHEFDRFFRTISGAATELPCPTCGKTAERLLSGGAGLVFKGSGFYLTDYGKNAHRGDASPGAPKGDSKSESSGEAKSAESKSAESKSESSSKPETKSESKSDAKGDSKSTSTNSSSSTTKASDK